MLRSFILGVLVLGCFYLRSQEERADYATVAKEFMSLYNEDKYEEIFNKFDAKMQEALPLEKTIELLSKNVKSNFGGIKSMEFAHITKGSHIYLTTFEQSALDISIHLNEANKIDGLFMKPHRPDNLPILERNTTKMKLPFKEEWFVFWGGTEVAQNYHVAYENQKYAYDLLMVKDGSSYSGDSKKNENYYVFGKEIIAPCDARVVKVISGVHDNIPGELNPAQLTGNTVVLETKNKEYLLFAHLKENSIVVEKDQQVRQGQLLGLCGNSGNTTEPHLHLSLQNVEDMNIATGAKLYFDKIKVNGEIKTDYLPLKEDKIKNAN